MDIKDFIQNFADLFDDTDASLITTETKFRELEEWSSLAALNVLMMIDEEYGVELPADEMRKTNTIKELFDMVQSKL